MGSILVRKAELLGTLGELVGHKSGLALSREEIYSHLPDYDKFWKRSDDEYVCVDSVSYEEMTWTILHGVGTLSSPKASTSLITLHHKYKGNSYKHDLLLKISTIFIDVVNEAPSDGKPIDIEPFITKSEELYGSDAMKIAREFAELLIQHLVANSWTPFRRTEWKDTKDQEELFKSESLETAHGKYFDQRFIDYLSNNFGSIDGINWRKFEGLTCEYFSREGFYVEIGEGRGDNNIDARIWPRKEDKDLPPTIIVQCKRQKAKIEKTIVKALWADIIAEEAKSGLVVTTSVLSPGAKKVCIARAYPIKSATRDTVRTWIENMRSPYAGVMLGE